MSVEHRHTDAPIRVCVQRTASDTTVQDEPESSEHFQHTTRDPLSARIERTQLQLRIVALERELEASEDERQEIIDHYEFVLQNRESDSDRSTADDDGIVQRLRRLLD